MKTPQALALVLACVSLAQAQVNSGSNGSDGAFNPATNTIVDMADHPTGIYHYTSVNIPTNVTVTFIPNANNTPVVWLVQGSCAIDGYVRLEGFGNNGSSGGAAGPGGFKGGVGGNNATGGQGPGGGSAGVAGAHASYGTLGSTSGGLAPGSIYGNSFLIPLVGGSGGGGASGFPNGGGGGGGALMIAASGTITVNGYVTVQGGPGGGSGAGSGGAVRLVAQIIAGNGRVVANGNVGNGGLSGNGRVRFDMFENQFSGDINVVFTQGFQPIIIPTPGQGAQLTITSVGGVPVSASPSGILATPDAVLSPQQNNPVSVVVRCSNIPLNTQITVSVRPANGSPVSATGLNTSGTLVSSVATISMSIPRGGGIIYATAATAP